MRLMIAGKLRKNASAQLPCITMDCIDLPSPAESHRQLEAFVGSWHGEERRYSDRGDPEMRRGSLEMRMDLGGFFLISEYREDNPSYQHFRGHGIYGWDEGRGCFTMYWFDSRGGGGPANPVEGRYANEQLVFMRRSAKGFTRYIHRLASRDRYRFVIEKSEDGKTWRPHMECEYTRVPS